MTDEEIASAAAVMDALAAPYVRAGMTRAAAPYVLAAHVLRTAPGMADALASVEHSVTSEGSDMGFCPTCGRSEIRDHAESCAVGRALSAYREGPKP